MHWFRPEKKSMLALVAGMLLTFSFSPFSIWPLSFVSMAILCYCLHQQPWQQAAKLGFLFGFAWFAVGISWVHVSIAQFGGLPLIVSLALMAALAAYLALFPALASAVTAKLSKRYWLGIFIPIWLISEHLRGTLLTGFPWLSFGYSLTDSPLNVLAPVMGEFGLTACVILGGYGLFCLYIKQWHFAAYSLAVIVISSMLAPFMNSTFYQGEPIKVALVQGNIKQELRFDPDEFARTMLKYQDLTRLNWDVDLVVWPEAAVPEIEVMAQEYLQRIDSAAALNNTALITGIVDYQPSTKAIFNTLIVLGKQHNSDQTGHYQYLHQNRYQKYKLLPVGEFVPFEEVLRPLAPLFNLAWSSFTQGEQVQANLTANGLNILPAICFEIVFTDLVRDNYRNESDILFTVSNDAWFGDSHGPHQHMQIARMRAIELGRPLLRVTNNGITAIFDPLSGQQQRLAQFEAAVLNTSIHKIKGETFYAQYGKTPWWSLALLILLITIWLNYRLKSQ
ncbi:apolipoprotein N-acyltransferase [Pseudoalteromonas ulvae UL12]|nr:apolipoprotein N-acyltransferase [Pseudoalteromonas ulvae]MBE0362503.1 apolipoprotein N-acyltransferase [Pseudoalteromonas ulvae UL12]